MTSFDDAFKLLIGNEGGYSNNPRDPGGETNWGITKRTAIANGYTGEMRLLTLTEAKRIAKSEYWDKYHCDDFDPRLAYQIFDIVYNGGYPIKWLQLSLGIAADGICGQLTLDKIKTVNILVLIAKINAYRLLYYTSLKTWPEFGKGWANRVANNILEGLK
jgi:lysozyme family protein